MSANVLVGKGVLLLLNDSLLSANIAAIAGLAVSIPISFLGSMLWVFKK
jgi:putative flippase GtrA